MTCSREGGEKGLGKPARQSLERAGRGTRRWVRSSLCPQVPFPARPRSGTASHPPLGGEFALGSLRGAGICGGFLARLMDDRGLTTASPPAAPRLLSLAQGGPSCLLVCWKFTPSVFPLRL